MNKLIVLALLMVTTINIAFSRVRIARVEENGDVTFDRDTGFAPEIIEVEISEVDGAVYVSTNDVEMLKFDENGYYDAGFDLPMLDDSIGFDINYEDYLWIAGSEIYGDHGLYKYTDNGDYVDGIEDFDAFDAGYEDDTSEIWSNGGHPIPEKKPGIHKFEDPGTRIFYKPQYLPDLQLANGAPDGSIWFQNNRYGGLWELVKMAADGSEEFRLANFDFPLDPQVDPNDGSCWVFERYLGDLYKVDAFGSIIFHDGSFNEIAAIDVDESDGSVWVASNIPKRLVHLDKDGNRQLYKQWPGGDFAHLAVDQRNGTCIVIYEESKSGDLNIQPASVGEIKAMYR